MSGAENPRGVLRNLREAPFERIGNYPARLLQLEQSSLIKGLIVSSKMEETLSAGGPTFRDFGNPNFSTQLGFLGADINGQGIVFRQFTENSQGYTIIQLFTRNPFVVIQNRYGSEDRLDAVWYAKLTFQGIETGHQVAGFPLAGVRVQTSDALIKEERDIAVGLPRVLAYLKQYADDQVR